jgi:hypothetical protein
MSRGRRFASGGVSWAGRVSGRMRLAMVANITGAIAMALAWARTPLADRSGTFSRRFSLVGGSRSRRVLLPLGVLDRPPLGEYGVKLLLLVCCRLSELQILGIRVSRRVRDAFVPRGFRILGGREAR